MAVAGINIFFFIPTAYFSLRPAAMRDLTGCLFLSFVSLLN